MPRGECWGVAPPGKSEKLDPPRLFRKFFIYLQASRQKIVY